MNGEPLPLIPPLEGCLYCHREGTTSLAESRSFLDPAGARLLLRCSHCHSVAELDYDPQRTDSWRIRYRRTNHDPRYYYVAIHYGKHGWLDAPDALEISRRGFAQRIRVRQAEVGDFSWIEPAPVRTALAPARRERPARSARCHAARDLTDWLLHPPQSGRDSDSGRCCEHTAPAPAGAAPPVGARSCCC